MAFTLIREERIAHTGNGLQLDADLYIKLDAAFDDLVAELGRGGQLPALIHIQLREAYASSGQGDPATLKTIGHAASCEERQARRIVKSLLAKCLIAEAGLSPITGEKFYRPLAYAWFGSRNEPKTKRPTDGMSSVTPQDIGGVKCQPPDTVVVDAIPSNKHKLEQQTTRSREILKKCGILGKPLDRLSENVAPETAKAWFDWLEHAPSYLRNPIGVVVNALLADPDARPVMREKSGAMSRVRKPTIIGKLVRFNPSEEGDEPNEDEK